ncbi:Crp/Fnr family transcriptional regulator [bacterium]|nr:Crp/Fnr family transcriptional regulator [bacterium]
MEEKDIRNTLAELPMFTALRDEDIVHVARLCTVLRCEKGEILFREGDAYRGFYVVLEGGVKVYKLSPEGKETVLHIQFPPKTLAEIPMFAGEDYPAFAECLAPSRLLFVEKEGFLALLRETPDLALRMLAGLSKRLRELGAQLEHLTAHDVRTRLIRYLLEEYGRQHKAERVLPLLVLPISKTLLAAHLGTTLETLSRTLRKMEEEQRIKLKGKTVLLEDVPALQREYHEASGH